MTIYYFSGTGNCLSVAKKLGDRLIAIPQAMKEEKIQCADDAIGLVLPVYGLCVPPYIRRFLSRASFDAPYLFAVLTYGTYDGGAVSQLAQCADENGIRFDYIHALHMQENYLPGFAMEKQTKPASQDEKLKQILDDIGQRKHFCKRNSWFDRFMTSVHQKSYQYEIGAGFTESFSVADSCAGCGQCQTICPLGNIRMEEGKPVFGSSCCSCFACIQNCPRSAITLKGEKSHARYRNPEVTVSELVRTNQQS